MGVVLNLPGEASPFDRLFWGWSLDWGNSPGRGLWPPAKQRSQGCLSRSAEYSNALSFLYILSIMEFSDCVRLSWVCYTTELWLSGEVMGVAEILTCLKGIFATLITGSKKGEGKDMLFNNSPQWAFSAGSPIMNNGSKL